MLFIHQLSSDLASGERDICTLEANRYFGGQGFCRVREDGSVGVHTLRREKMTLFPTPH